MNKFEHSLQTRIERYLKRQMPPDERRAFEQDLKSDAPLANAYIRYSLSDEGKKIHELAELRQLAQAIRAESAPLPEPNITLLDRFRFLLYEPVWRRGLMMVAGVAVIALLWTTGVMPGSQKKPIEQLIGQHFMEPASTSYAGGEANTTEEADMKDLFTASEFYFGVRSGSIDSIKYRVAQCKTQFCFSVYYLAHWQLRSGEYAEAQQNLATCVRYEPVLQSNDYTKQTDKIYLNLILADLGTTKDRAKARAAAQALLLSRKCSGDVCKHLEALVAEL